MNTRVFLVVLSALLVWNGNAVADSVEISEWLVPWKKSRPRDPFVDRSGRVWFVGERGDYVANLTPESGDFSRYDVEPGSEPHNLLVGPDRSIWFAASGKGYIGKLNPGTGQTTQLAMPERKAKDPHTLVFDSAGDIWFTVHQGNFLGKLDTSSGAVQLIDLPGRKSRPSGIVVNSRGEPWATASSSNKLLRINPDTMSVAEVELPDDDARPIRLGTTSDGNVWWTDIERGYLGRLNPATGEFREWPMPGGSKSEPYGMTVDRLDRIWIVETGDEPNRFIGFDTGDSEFFSITEIPSGGGSVRHLHYFEPAGEIWFGTDTNYIGRARVH